VILFWVIAAIGCGYLAYESRGGRRLLAGLGCAAFVTLAALAGEDNARTRNYDCRRAVDPYTGEDVQSCLTDHWLPNGLRLIANPDPGEWRTPVLVVLLLVIGGAIGYALRGRSARS
jgi:hypothetical protein